MKRQANALTAVLENWQDVENAIDIYANSAGSALRENEIYLDSWEAKSKAVGAAWNEFVNSFVNSEWIKSFLDGAQATLSFLTKTEAAMGVLAGVITGVLAAAFVKGTFTVEGFNAALLKANILSGGIPLLIGLITTVAVGVVSWGISASDTAKQIENLTTKIEEQQRTIDELNAKEKEATDLYKEYASLMSKSNAYGLTADEKENLLNISNQLVDTYGLEVQGIDALTGAYVIGTSAINDYVEALRAERLEKQKEQTDTRNTRIDKNIVKAMGYKNDIPKVVSDYASRLYKRQKNDPDEFANSDSLAGQVLLESGIVYTGSDDVNFVALKNYFDTGNEAFLEFFNDFDEEQRKKGAVLESKLSAVTNSIIEDIITNIQIENADTITQTGESILTSMLQTILPNIEDLDKTKVKEIQDKINEFAETYGRAFDELGAGQQKIQEKIKNNTAGIADYKDLLDSQMKQMQVVEQIFGATSEEANAFREQLNKSIENNTGLYFANISKTMSESDLDTSEFDKVTSAILKLDGAMANGEITFSEYVDELNKNLDNISLESTFQGDENAAKSFFAVLNDKGKKAIQNLMAQYQNGEISQKDYLSGIADMVDYFENLSNQATLMLGVDSSELSETIDGLKEAQNELNNFKSVVQTIPDTFEEFKNGGVSSVSALTSALEKAGITSMEIGGKVRNTSKEIAQAMQENAENFAEAKEKIADDFRKNLTTIGKNLATAVNKMIEIFGEVKIVIDPPDVSLWDWLKAMFTGKTEEMVFGVKIDGEADPESWGKHFGDLAEELDWGFDDFTGGGGGNPPPYTPPGDKDKDKDKPDYEDPTDAIINCINLRAKELKQEEEEIQNALELAEIEGDYAKQFELTNQLVAKRKERITELTTANNNLHNEAQYIRDSNPWDEDSWFDSQGNATEAYLQLYNSSSKEQQEKIKEVFDNLSKYKKAYADNVEEIADITKQNLQDESFVNSQNLKIYLDKASKLYELHNNELKYINDLQWALDNLIMTEEERLDIEKKIEEAKKKNATDAISNIEYRRDMALARNPLVDTRPYYRQMQEEYQREEKRISDTLRAQGVSEEDIANNEEIQKYQRLWWDAEKAILDYNKSIVQDFFNEVQDKIDDSYDIRINRLNSQSSLLSSHFNIVNAIAEEQHNLNKELLEAETIGARMNEQERESLLTKAEHSRLSGKLSNIMIDITSLQQDYMRDLENATKDTINEITNQYERQYELKMKEYEIVKAELALAKAQQVLENTKNEKSVRTWNGSGWTYAANIQDVIDAQEEVENAKYALVQSKTKEAQQKAINAIDANVDALETEKNKLTTALETLAENLNGTGKDISSMLKTIAKTDLPTFDAIIRSLGDSIKTTFGISPSDINKIRYKAANSHGESSILGFMKSNSEAWHTASDTERESLEKANRTYADYLGLDYEESTGRWKKKDGTYAYASGTLNAKRGAGLFDEDGFGSELILTKDGILTQFDGGERVFTSEMADRLWEMAQQNYKFAPSVVQPDFGKVIPIEDRINNAINNISNAFGDTYMIKDVQLNEIEGGTLKGFINFLKKKI